MSKVVIYTSDFCGYCGAAKRLLQDKGVQFEEINLSQNHEMREEVMRRSGRRTVPQIFIDDKAVGGFDDIRALDQAGELDALLGL